MLRYCVEFWNKDFQKYVHIHNDILDHKWLPEKEYWDLTGKIIFLSPYKNRRILVNIKSYQIQHR